MKNALFLFLILFLSKNCFAQDISFTQFNSAPLWYNPAFAGSRQENRFSVLYRNDLKPWGNYQTVYASYDQYVRQVKGGVGFMTMYDRADLVNTFTNSLVYAPKIKLSSTFSISPGITFSHFYKAVDISQLNTLGYIIDPRYGYFLADTSQVEELIDHKSFFDLSTGIVLNTTSFYIGIAVNHLLEPDQ